MALLADGSPRSGGRGGTHQQDDDIDIRRVDDDTPIARPARSKPIEQCSQSHKRWANEDRTDGGIGVSPKRGSEVICQMISQRLGKVVHFADPRTELVIQSMSKGGDQESPAGGVGTVHDEAELL